MIKKKLIFVVLFYASYLFCVAAADIIPIKKPVQTKEETEKKLLIDILKPIPKPIKKTEVKQSIEKKIVKKDTTQGLILPKKNLLPFHLFSKTSVLSDHIWIS